MNVNHSKQNVGLLHVKIKNVMPLNDKKFNACKLLVKVADQGYLNILDLSAGTVELSQVKMYQCSDNDSMELQFNDNKNNYEAELRFPLKKLTQMPRVKHIVEAVLIKKVEKQAKKNHQMKIENMLQVDLQLIYLNNIQGKFIIQTMEVQLTRDTQLIGKMDPYIILKLGSKSYTTKAKQNQGKNCIWTERIEMEVHQSGKSILNLKVFDQDPLKDDLICSAQIFLLKQGLLIPSQKPKERQFSLFYDKKVAGTIKLEYQFQMLPFNY